MKIDLRGQVALVTGGSRGIGAAISETLAAAGATVAINFLKDRQHAQKLIEKLRKKRLTGFLVPGDVSDFVQADSVVHQVIEKVRRLDILVNNAGIWKLNPIDNPRVEEMWDRTIQMNLKSTFNMCAHAVPYLTKSKAPKIINISSTAGQRGESNHSDYAASKGAVIAFTKSLAVEVASKGILVNCVAPGWVATDMTYPYLKKVRNRREVIRQIPLGRIADPQDIANARSLSRLPSLHAHHGRDSERQRRLGPLRLIWGHNTQFPY